MSKYLLAVVVFVVLISGCFGQPPVDQEIECATSMVNGLSITCFSSSVGDLRSGQSTTLQLEVENKGEDVVSQEWGAAHLIIPTDWSLEKAVTLAYPKDLKNADPATGRPADIYQFRWRATSPGLPRGQVRYDTIIGRVYYDYTTTASGVIPVYPYGEDIVETASFTSSVGPVAISVAVMPNPPAIEFAGEEFSLSIVVTNTGEGQVYMNNTVNSGNLELEETERDIVNLDIVLPTGLNVTDPGCYKDIELIRGRATAICDVEVIDKPVAKQLHPVTIKAYYGYMIEASTTVSITGR
ncbi:MAG: hypothetical protein ACE5J7_01170 [Candidatus Aenigmatarchaeota archaeon]